MEHTVQFPAIRSACLSTMALRVHVSSQQEVDGMVAELSKAGAMRNTTVVSAAEGCGLGERYAALCSALSMGERVRDQGGHSFVVLDDISCMVSLKCLPNVETHFYCPQAFLSLDFLFIGMTFLSKNRRFRIGKSFLVAQLFQIVFIQRTCQHLRRYSRYRLQSRMLCSILLI